MIFISKNEQEIPAWKLVLEGKKVVTRRLKPQPIDSIRAVQPGRGKKAIARIRIITCTKELWVGEGRIDKDREAKLEGFRDWVSVENYFTKQYGSPTMTVYRIQFALLEGE